ncbi:hypothetical protein GCM10027049_19340 [Mucilaginibacter puniceus]
MKKLLLLTMYLVICLGVSAQTISDIKISKDWVAYIKSGDSLFISGLKSDSKPIFVDKGLRANPNQRLLNWSPDNTQLIYEKRADRYSDLYSYNIPSHTSKILNTTLRDSLNLFRFYKVRQASISPQQQYYFASNIRGQEQGFQQLFKIDLNSGKISQLTNDTSDVGNVSVSHNGRHLIYATDKAINDKPQSILYLADNQVRVASSIPFKDTFFNGFSWSPNDNLILATADGGLSKLFRLNQGADTLQQLNLSLAGNETPVSFYNNNAILYTFTEGGNKKTGLLDLSTGIKTLLLTNNEILLTMQADGSNSQLLYLKESPTEPKAIWKKDLSSANGTLIKIMATVNPLAKYKYLIKTYQNGGGKSSSAYIYFPSNYNKTGKPHPVLLVPYGSYTNAYPTLDYFLNEVVFNYLKKGYIVIFPNTRGISSETQKDEYGKIQLEDTHLFIDQVKQELNVDMGHLWVIGHSHGATMVFYYLTHSDLFRGGIAINGAADWIKQAALKSMTGLPGGMGGSPEQFSDKYRAYSPLENIADLKKPILIFAGKKDTQIIYDINAVAFHELAIKNQKNTRLILFDNEGHLIQDPKNRKVFQKEVDDFLNNY